MLTVNLKELFMHGKFLVRRVHPAFFQLVAWLSSWCLQAFIFDDTNLSILLSVFFVLSLKNIFFCFLLEVFTVLSFYI